jgi:hypothetical protein
MIYLTDSVNRFSMQYNKLHDYIGSNNADIFRNQTINIDWKPAYKIPSSRNCIPLHLVIGNSHSDVTDKKVIICPTSPCDYQGLCVQRLAYAKNMPYCVLSVPDNIDYDSFKASCNHILHKASESKIILVVKNIHNINVHPDELLAQLSHMCPAHDVIYVIYDTHNLFASYKGMQNTCHLMPIIETLQARYNLFKHMLPRKVRNHISASDNNIYALFKNCCAQHNIKDLKVIARDISDKCISSTEWDRENVLHIVQESFVKHVSTFVKKEDYSGLTTFGLSALTGALSYLAYDRYNNQKK